MDKKLILNIIAMLGAGVLWAGSAEATTWYVRDGGGTPSQCTGTANAVYQGNGNNQPCALSNPMYVLGEGCGNGGWGPCDVAALMQDGDTLYIVGDSDLNTGQQAQYPIGLDVNGVVTPANANNCYAPGPENCTMGNLPADSSIIGIGTHKPQLWGREHIAQVINDNNSTSTVIDNLEITQHSACVYNGADPAGTTDGFPNACHTSDNGFSSPYGDWGLAGISLTGSNITLENNWIHGMGQWGVSTGSLTNFTEGNNIINGNGGGGMGLGQNVSNAGTMTLGGTTTVNGEIIVFNGCGSTYPLHSSDPFDTLNYHNCADDASSNGTILADGWAMEAGSGICTNVNISNSIVAYNTKGGIDNLHCNGSGTFTAYRVRAEGNESQQMKLNYGTVNVENSQIINNCNFFEGQPFTTTCDSNGSCPPSLGYDFCRAAGDGLRILLNNGNVYNISNSTFYSDGGANIEFPQATCNGAVVNINNNLIINAQDYTNSDSQNTDFYENDTDSCNPVVENYNLVYQPHDLSDCAGKNDICNPANPGVSGNFALNSSFVYTATGLADQFYPSAGSPLIGAANSRLVLNGTSNDYNNYARSSTSWDIGSYQNGSSVANGNACFSNGECSSNNCSNNFCTAVGSTPNPGSGGGTSNPVNPTGPVVSLTSPANGNSVAVGTNVALTASASETNGNIAQVSFYYNGTNLIGTSITPPYESIAVNLPIGNITLTAVATDSNGVSITSSPISMTVTSPTSSSTPIVTITNPTSGTSFIADSNITITATASESNGTITKVQFFDGTAPLSYTGTSSPYSYVWNDVQPGTYTMTAQATDANGAVTISAPITIVVNPTSTSAPSTPAVAMTSPANGSTFTGVSNITLTASASETNGTITKVQFFNGTSSLNYTGTSSPYSYVWSNVPPGTYTMAAQATDANGATVVSAPVTITVNPAPPATPSTPTVAITSPANGSTFSGVSNITFTASASETNGTITQVRFFNGTAPLNYTGTSSPYSYVWNDVEPGTYTMTAQATDANGVAVSSVPITITVNQPTPTTPSTPAVAMTSPAGGSTYSGVSNITLTASASETNGTIAQVKFYDGGIPLSYTGTGAPYSYVWNNVQPGLYVITAQATDGNGVVVASAPVIITVNPTVNSSTNSPTVAITSLANGSTFTGVSDITLTASASETNGTIAQVKFYDGGIPLSYIGTGAPYSYVWNNVQPGTYIMTAQATDSNGVLAISVPVTIVVNAATSPTTSSPTAPIVSITSPATGSTFTGVSDITLTASASETNGTIAQVKFYDGGIPLSYTGTAAPYSYVWNNVQPGTYTMTAQATDSNGVVTASAPITITVNSTAPVTAEAETATGSTGTVSLTSPANNASYTVPASIPLTANASETGGTITRIDYYSGTTALGAATSSPYAFTWNNAQAGTYTLIAVATDSSGNSFYSPAINITVGAHIPPTVTLTAPANNASYSLPANITLTANASVSSGSISKVDFYAGTSYVGTAYSTPYTFTWNNVQSGNYSLTAQATDSYGASTTSAAVNVAVQNDVEYPNIIAPVSNTVTPAPTAAINTAVTAASATADTLPTPLDNSNTVLTTSASGPADNSVLSTGLPDSTDTTSDVLSSSDTNSSSSPDSTDTHYHWKSNSSDFETTNALSTSNSTNSSSD